MKKKICLNMIVKNEEKIIHRCLESVISLIDFFVILDTGSTDNTIEKIKEFFEGTKIKGIIKKGEFNNFSYARNNSLSIAYEKSNCDYIFFIDADMILNCGNINLDLNLDGYYITQGDEKIEYKNIRIIKNHKKFYYRGYTHEVLVPFKGNGLKVGYINSLKIIDIGDGGSKMDKIERDIFLLTQEIEKNPKYSRPYFYLANTYFGKGDLELSEKFYRERINYGGWKEEIWYCYYRLALIKIIQKKIPEAIWFLFSSIETNSKRLESYFHLLFLFRENKMVHNYEIFRKKALSVYEEKLDPSNYLFYEKELCQAKIIEML